MRQTGVCVHTCVMRPVGRLPPAPSLLKPYPHLILASSTILAITVEPTIYIASLHHFQTHEANCLSQFVHALCWIYFYTASLHIFKAM